MTCRVSFMRAVREGEGVGAISWFVATMVRESLGQFGW